MFNENKTFFEKNILDSGFWMLDTRKKFYRRGYGFIATKRQKMYKSVQKVVKKVLYEHII